MTDDAKDEWDQWIDGEHQATTEEMVATMLMQASTAGELYLGVEGWRGIARKAIAIVEGEGR